jgi:predicted  nucleic acid-binding Zn-ribbon protein
MLELIEKLLILQDRDRKISRVRGELAHIEPERQSFRSRAAEAQKALENARERVKQIESDRKNLELEVEAKKQLIAKYALQQFQTRKNEEYRALAHEIDQCKAEIVKIEDQELELMEKAEAAQKEVARRNQGAAEVRKLAEDQIAELGTRENTLKKELAELEVNREELATAVGDSARSRYERLIKNKGENVVVGVQHGVCGGCHMRIPPQLLVSCQAQQELVTCSNCGRILYYSRDMDLAVAE